MTKLVKSFLSPAQTIADVCGLLSGRLILSHGRLLRPVFSMSVSSSRRGVCFCVTLRACLRPVTWLLTTHQCPKLVRLERHCMIFLSDLIVARTGPSADGALTLPESPGGPSLAVVAPTPLSRPLSWSLSVAASDSVFLRSLIYMDSMRASFACHRLVVPKSVE